MSYYDLDNKRIIKPSTLPLIKFILTFGFVIFYTIPVVQFLSLINVIEIHTGIIGMYMFVFGMTMVIAYVSVRTIIHFKSKYKFTKREFRLMALTYGLVGILMFLILIFMLIQANPKYEKAAKILFYIIEPTLVGLGIASSMLEQRARISEQVHIYNKWYNSLDEKHKAKEDNKANAKRKEVSEEDILIEEKQFKNKENPFMDDETRDDVND